MKICFHSMLIAAMTCVPALTYCQASKVLIEKNPRWVNPVSYDPLAEPPAGQESGYYYLLIDEQENTLEQELYQRFAYKVLTNEGLQEMADISVGFDPNYQTLIFHQVDVLRAGEKINQLAKNNMQVIQREQSMDRYLYDGTLTAVINLKDIRVGDVIEYSFTRKGYNPVYNGHFSKKIYFNYNLPFEKSYQRLVVRPSMPLNLEYRNADLKPEIKSTERQKEYVWNSNKMSGVLMDNNLPDWYDGNQHVSITDFKDWGEVAAWAARHFETDKDSRQALKRAINSLLKSEGDATYALEAVRFVQDDIRYLGFEAGLNSHKPHPPKKVFDQRFGDCKDKSLLLCEILRLRAIEAFPVLVSTVTRGHISNEPPSIYSFNHCVVQFKLGNTLYYVDPTINNQGGPLETNYFPPYAKGLVVDAATRSLIDLPSPVTSEISEMQTFEVAALTGEARLNVRTTYTGLEADYMRSQFLSNSLESVQKNYVTFYTNLYPDIEIDKPLTKHDNRNENIFTVEENYRIPTFWHQNETDEEQMFCEVYPQTLETYFNVTKSSQRSAPYRLAYPISYHHYIHIKLPEEWTVEPDDKLIETDFYEYEHLVRYANKEVTLQTHYETKQDFIPAESYDQFAADHQEMMNNLNFQIHYNKNVMANENGISWMGIFTSVAALAFGIWFVVRIFYYYDPKALQPVPDGEPIGGWLILPAIGLVITPFRLVYDLFNIPEVYDSSMWQNLLTLKRYGLFGFIYLEHIYNIVLLPFSILLLVLFFKRRTSFPRLMTIYLAVTCFVTIFDSAVSAQIDSSAAQTSYPDIMRSVVAAMIWIPYFNMSTRVKETFVYRVNDDDDNIYAVELVGDQAPSRTDNEQNTNTY